MAILPPHDKPAAPSTGKRLGRLEGMISPGRSFPMILASVAAYSCLKRGAWPAASVPPGVWLVVALGAVAVGALVASRPRAARGAVADTRMDAPTRQAAGPRLGSGETVEGSQVEKKIAMRDFTKVRILGAAAEARARRSDALVAVARVSMESAIAACGDRDLHISLAALIDLALEALRSAMGLDPQETWTLTICRIDGATRPFRPVVARGSGVAGVPSRDWQGAEGMIREVYRGRNELRVDDIETLPWLWLEPTGEGPNPPPRACRSLAAFRVEQGPGRPDWGVVVATSSCPGRFDSELETLGWAHAEAVRLFTLAVALVVRACANDGDEGPGEPTPVPAPVRPSGPPADFVEARAVVSRVLPNYATRRREVMACG